MRKTVNLAEPVFYSLQGEGPHAGRPSIFIRFSGCNFFTDPQFKPCPWCDTGYALRKDAGKKYTISKILKDIEKLSEENMCKHLVFTGGEPLLYQDEIREIWNEFYDSSKFTSSCDIETNGSLGVSGEFLDDTRETLLSFVISPKFHQEYSVKLLGSLQEYYEDDDDNELSSWLYRAPFFLKFVYSDEESGRTILRVLYPGRPYNIERIPFPRSKIWIMPEGTTREKQLELQEEVVKFCLEHGFNFSPRIHILTWGNVKGK